MTRDRAWLLLQLGRRLILLHPHPHARNRRRRRNRTSAHLPLGRPLALGPIPVRCPTFPDRAARLRAAGGSAAHANKYRRSYAAPSLFLADLPGRNRVMGRLRGLQRSVARPWPLADEASRGAEVLLRA